MNNELILQYTHDELLNEFLSFQSSPGNLNMYSTHNKIVNYFQQEYMFRNERMLWEDKNIRNKLIENRKKYLGENTYLSPSILLNGFKISGIYHGYSGFNPLLLKWFCQNYDLINKSLYDPCGGWGHRILGSGLLKQYIYNDISPTIYRGVYNIVKYFDIPNAVLYNNDCIQWTPQEEFDAIFTCPPYYNIEQYESPGFSTKEEFNNFLNRIIDIPCGVKGIVMKESLMKESLMNRTDYKEKITLNKYKSHLCKSKTEECLYIWYS